MVITVHCPRLAAAPGEEKSKYRKVAIAPRGLACPGHARGPLKRINAKVATHTVCLTNTRGTAVETTVDPRSRTRSTSRKDQREAANCSPSRREWERGEHRGWARGTDEGGEKRLYLQLRELRGASSGKTVYLK